MRAAVTTTRWVTRRLVASVTRASRGASDAARESADGSDDGLAITEACERRLREIARERRDAARLRLSVSGGGCSGFKYEFTLEKGGDAARDAEGGGGGGADDRVFRGAHGGEVVVDGISYEFVRGSTIDYVEEMIKSSFEVVKNPRAKTSCGCGTSFDPKADAFGK